MKRTLLRTLGVGSAFTLPGDVGFDMDTETVRQSVYVVESNVGWRGRLPARVKWAQNFTRDSIRWFLPDQVVLVIDPVWRTVYTPPIIWPKYT